MSYVLRYSHVQGGTLNHGLLFAGPPLSPLGVIQNDMQKLMGDCPNDGVNVAAGMSGLAVAVEMLNYHSELSGKKKKMKVS